MGDRFRDFIRAFGGHWLAYMSGAPSVPLALAAPFASNDLVKLGLALTAIACFVFASFVVWREERRKLIALLGSRDQREHVDQEMATLDVKFLAYMKEMSTGIVPTSIPEHDWPRLLKTKMVKRGFVGLEGIIPEFLPLVRDWFERNK